MVQEGEEVETQRHAAPGGAADRRRPHRGGGAAAAVAVVLAVLVGSCSADEAVDRASPSTTVRSSNPTITAPPITASDPTVAPEGSEPGNTGGGTTRPPGSTTRPANPVGPIDGLPPVIDAPATALVDGLRVLDVPVEVPDYRRKEFGDGWDYDPESGCNVRERVLIEESLEPPTMGERCKPLAGRWVSAYDGVETADPTDLEIDHFVPLAEAWRTGAAGWTPERRETFANDMTDPATLVAVTSRSNRSKGDSPPDRWLPPSRSARCDYVEDWVRVKARWDLAVSPAEKSTLVQVLSGC